MVVVPTIFSSESQVEALLEKTRSAFPRQSGRAHLFALLGDFPDADAEEDARR